jgi:transcription elongation factor Elf1
MSKKRERWEVIADLARAQQLRRIEADPRLEQWIGGPGPRGTRCAYAAQTQWHAEAMHARRMRGIIERRRAEADLPPHLDCPYCPACASPCGTTDRDDVFDSVSAVACGACGHSWVDDDDRAQAERADAAYARHREEEAQREADAALLGPDLLAINDRMLAVARTRAATPTPQPEQLGLL